MSLNMKRLQAALLAMVLVFSILGAAQAEEPQISEEDLKAIEEALLDQSKDLPIGEEFRVTVPEGDLSVTEGLDENVINILLLGTDTRSIRLNYGRTDTMIIMSLNKQTGKIRLASLVRDMYVKLPYYKNSYKINAANAFGGPLLAVKTVNENFGLNIRSYVSINFSGFTKVIDSLGGVEMVLRPSEAITVGVPHTEEPQLLNGEQALKYVRIRSTDNNFVRNERQRKLLTSLFNKMLSSSNLQTAMAALTEALTHMATNLSMNDVVTLVLPVFKGMEGMDTTGFPAEGDYSYGNNERDQALVLFNLETTKQKLHDYLYQGIQP